MLSFLYQYATGKLDNSVTFLLKLTILSFNLDKFICHVRECLVTLLGNRSSCSCSSQGLFEEAVLIIRAEKNPFYCIINKQSSR